MGIIIENQNPVSTTIKSPLYETPDNILQFHDRLRKKTATGTFLIALACVTVGCNANANELPPTYLPYLHHDVNNECLIEPRENNSDLLQSYIVGVGERQNIFNLINSDIDVKNLVKNFPQILREVYGKEVEKHIKISGQDDPDDQSIEILIYTSLPIEEEFIEKNKLLIKRIEDSNPDSIFEKIIISQR